MLHFHRQQDVDDTAADVCKLDICFAVIGQFVSSSLAQAGGCPTTLSAHILSRLAAATKSFINRHQIPDRTYGRTVHLQNIHHKASELPKVLRMHEAWMHVATHSVRQNASKAALSRTRIQMSTPNEHSKSGKASAASGELEIVSLSNDR